MSVQVRHDGCPRGRSPTEREGRHPPTCVSESVPAAAARWCAPGARGIGPEGRGSPDPVCRDSPRPPPPGRRRRAVRPVSAGPRFERRRRGTGASRQEEVHRRGKQAAAASSSPPPLTSRTVHSASTAHCAPSTHPAAPTSTMTRSPPSHRSLAAPVCGWELAANDSVVGILGLIPVAMASRTPWPCSAGTTLDVTARCAEAHDRLRQSGVRPTETVVEASVNSSGPAPR